VASRPAAEATGGITSISYHTHRRCQRPPRRVERLQVSTGASVISSNLMRPMCFRISDFSNNITRMPAAAESKDPARPYSNANVRVLPPLAGARPAGVEGRLSIRTASIVGKDGLARSPLISARTDNGSGVPRVLTRVTVWEHFRYQQLLGAPA